MRYYSTQYWNAGRRKRNEDSLCVEQVRTRRGRVLMAAVCDGIGGLSEGETASGYVVEELVKWFYEEGVPKIRFSGMDRMKGSLMRRLEQINNRLYLYGEKKGIRLGTTASILLLWENQYAVFQIGDSRIYRIRFRCRQLTTDQINKQGALLQGIGAARSCVPAVQTGAVRNGERFLVCSDGFYRRQTGKEFAKLFGRRLFQSKGGCERHLRNRVLREVGERLLRQGETDNISAVLIICERGGREHA